MIVVVLLFNRTTCYLFPGPFRSNLQLQRYTFGYLFIFVLVIKHPLFLIINFSICPVNIRASISYHVYCHIPYPSNIGALIHTGSRIKLNLCFGHHSLQQQTNQFFFSDNNRVQRVYRATDRSVVSITVFSLLAEEFRQRNTV